MNETTTHPTIQREKTPEVANLIDKLNQIGTPLGKYLTGKIYRGLKTGFSKAFVIDAATREKLVTQDANNADLIKPWLRGRDLRQWQSPVASAYVIVIPSSANYPWPWANAANAEEAWQVFEQTYPALHAYFRQWEKELHQRHDQGKYFWELRSCAYYDQFAKPKIVYPESSKWMRACYDTSGALCTNTTYLLPTEDLYLLGILHSNIFDWYARHEFQAVGNPWSLTGRLRFLAHSMEKFPIAPLSEGQVTAIRERVTTLMGDDTLKQSQGKEEMDELLFDLYQLTPLERELIHAEAKLHSFTEKYAGAYAEVPDEEE